MTIPSERTRAVLKAKEFLLALSDPKRTPRVPKKIRKEALEILKHYPWNHHLEQTSKALPNLWGKEEK